MELQRDFHPDHNLNRRIRHTESGKPCLTWYIYVYIYIYMYRYGIGMV